MFSLHEAGYNMPLYAVLEIFTLYIDTESIVNGLITIYPCFDLRRSVSESDESHWSQWCQRQPQRPPSGVDDAVVY
jgi:hypothetical protein